MKTHSQVLQREPDAQTGRLAYRGLCLLLMLFIICSWLPRQATVGDTDIGLGALLIALIALLMMLAPAQAGIDRQASSLRLLLVTSIGCLLCWGYIGIYFVDQPLRAGRLILSFGQGIVIMLLISVYLSPRALRAALVVSAIMLVGTSALGLYAYLGGGLGGLIFQEGTDRASGFFKNANQYGMVCALVAPFGLACLWQPGRRLIGAVVLVAALLGLVLSASKTNLIVALVILFATLVWCAVAARRGVLLAILLPILAVSVFFGGLPFVKLFNPRAAMLLEAQLHGSPTPDAGPSSLDTRMELWRYSIDAMRRSPLLGEGAGQRFDVILEDVTHSHNIFLDLGRTTGIPGLLAGIVMAAACLWLAYTTLRRLASLPADTAAALSGRAAIVGACFAIFSYILSNQMSDSFGPSTSVFFWLCVGLVLRRHDLVFGSLQGATPAATAGQPYPATYPAASRVTPPEPYYRRDRQPANPLALAANINSCRNPQP